MSQIDTTDKTADLDPKVAKDSFEQRLINADLVTEGHDESGSDYHKKPDHGLIVSVTSTPLKPSCNDQYRASPVFKKNSLQQN